MNNRPIGIFDSGIGGLTVWKEITTLLPGESLIYLAGQAYFPYGEKSNREIQERVEKICRFLIKNKVKLIVVACNTATVAAIDFLRKKFSLPFIGLEPAIKPAAKMTKTGIIGVLVTRRTAKSRRQRKLIEGFAQGKKVVTVDGSELTPLIEAGQEARLVLEKLLLPLKKLGVDALVLGSTHYPFLKKQIQDIMGPGVKIIDSGQAVARQVRRVLEESNLLSNQEKGKRTFFTTANPSKFQTLATSLLGFPVKASKWDS